MITADYIKEGAVVIDVGVKPFRNRKTFWWMLTFDNVLDVAGYITLSPKGCGPDAQSTNASFKNLNKNLFESPNVAGVVCK